MPAHNQDVVEDVILYLSQYFSQDAIETETSFSNSVKFSK